MTILEISKRSFPEKRHSQNIFYRVFDDTIGKMIPNAEAERKDCSVYISGDLGEVFIPYGIYITGDLHVGEGTIVYTTGNFDIAGHIDGKGTLVTFRGGIYCKSYIKAWEIVSEFSITADSDIIVENTITFGAGSLHSGGEINCPRVHCTNTTMNIMYDTIKCKKFNCQKYTSY